MCFASEAAAAIPPNSMSKLVQGHSAQRYRRQLIQRHSMSA